MKTVTAKEQWYAEAHRVLLKTQAFLAAHPDLYRTEETMKYTSKGCWYEIWIQECVLCGHTKEYRERRSGPKPEVTHHFEQYACCTHFM